MSNQQEDQDILNEAIMLAAAHRQADSGTEIIKFFPDARNGEVCLLEVSDFAPTIGEILPFTFAADPQEGINYPSTVILVSQEDWQRVDAGELPLPPEWELSKAVNI